jgi:hypothetical protein
VTRLDWLTYDLFGGRTGERFEVAVDDGEPLELELTEATESTELGGPGPDGQERRQFSLIFRGPATPFVPQGTYALSHAELGELDLFLVPLGPDGDGMRYEAAFA